MMLQMTTLAYILIILNDFSWLLQNRHLIGKKFIEHQSYDMIQKMEKKQMSVKLQSTYQTDNTDLLVQENPSNNK